MTTQTDRERLADRLAGRMCGACKAYKEHLSLADALISAGWALPKPEADLSQKQRYANHYEEQIGFLVERFADALSSKLRKAEEKYQYQGAWRRAGWASECRSQLLRHADKGDPLDVAAYCAFAWHHGWSLAPDPIEPEAEDRETAQICALASAIMDAGVDCADTFARDVLAGLRHRGYDVLHSGALAAKGAQSRAQAIKEIAHGQHPEWEARATTAEAALERARAALRDVRRVVVGEHAPSWVSQDGIRDGRQKIDEICNAALETPPCK